MIELYCGDFREIVPKLQKSFDLIVADPPYAKKYNYLYSALGDITETNLKDHGFLLTILPHFNIHKVIQLIERPGIRFWWLLYMYHKPPSVRSQLIQFGVKVDGKPIGWFIKGTRPKKLGYRNDVCLCDKEKGLFKWQQPLDWGLYCVEHFSELGDCVLDPMMGVGTIGEACKLLERDFIGIELDPEIYTIAKERLK